MKIKIVNVIILIMLISSSAFAQRPAANIAAAFNFQYQALVNNLPHKFGSVEPHARGNINNAGDSLMNLLIEMETATEAEKEISANTRRLIIFHSFKNEVPLNNDTNIYIMVLIERALKENLAPSPHLKEKLLKAISTQIQLITKAKYPYYTYETKNKQMIKFVSIRTGNDLFTIAGLIGTLFFKDGKYFKDGNTFFQRNDDRDYTGNVLVEVATDYFNPLRRRPLKTYQTLLWGNDVYTPYFRDFTVFKADTSVDSSDRPHASFQYFGWSKKGISKSDKYKWSSTIKIGKIGGSAGAKFQNLLHQDVSGSPRPRGWGAQIAAPGRMGISLEFKEEFLQIPLTEKLNLHPDHFGNVYFSFFSEQKLGNYMTNGSAGIQISNKNFSQNNHNFINHRIRQTVYGKFNHLMYNIAFSATGVKHNTMLEGYGYLKTIEPDGDPLTPNSRYFLTYKQVKRVVYMLNITVSYTTRFATFFYNWKSISSETNATILNTHSPLTKTQFNITNRWQHFAEIGLTFNLH